MRIYRILPLKSIQTLLEYQTQHEGTFPYKVNIFPSVAAALFHVRNSVLQPLSALWNLLYFSTLQLIVSFSPSSPPPSHNSTCRDV